MGTEITVMVIFLIIMVLFIVFCIRMAVVLSKSQKRVKQEMALKCEQYGASATATLPLVAGLPLAEGTICRLFVTDKQLVIEAEAQVFQIELSKMIAAQAKSDLEIQKEVTSSMKSAVAGALFFGPAGAVIGARTRTKKHTVVYTYLIINYINQAGDTAVLAFDGANTVVLNALNAQLQRMRAGAVTNL